MNEAIVSENDTGIRLDRWFKRHCPGLQHAMLEKLLRKGAVRVNSAKAKASDRLELGQKITYPTDIPTASAPRKAAEKPTRAATQEAQAWVIYKDTNVLAIDKPAGLAVQGGSGQRTHVDALLDGLRFERTERPHLVHRLDKDTSGVLLLARHPRAAALLAERFAAKEEGEIEKYYLALVRGVPKPRQGEINLALAKVVRGKDSREAVDVDEGGRRAVSRYRVVEALGGKLAWVELQPITGRTHQLRVHMNAIGHPIIGDGKYGGVEAFIEGMDLSDRLHLHAHRIVLPDFMGRTLDITAKLPPHMRESATQLGSDIT